LNAQQNDKNGSKDAAKTCIYVFSGTGTSLAVAKRIGNSLGGTDVRLIPIEMEKAAGNIIKNEAATVGFVFPNYYGTLPGMVSGFIRALDLKNADYIFSVVTSGEGGGYCLKYLEQELKDKDKTLNYGKSLSGTDNYIIGWYYKMITKTGEKREEALRKAHERTDLYAKEIQNRKNEIEKGQYFSYIISQKMSPKKVVADTRPWDTDFSVDGDCIGCGTCEGVCQSGNIKLNDGIPVFRHNCQRCMACIHYCPKNAIGFKGKKLDKPRHFHPDFPAEELIRYIAEERVRRPLQ